MFAGRGIALPPLRITALVVAGALVFGVAAGWATETITDALKASGAPKEAVSAAPDTEQTATPVIPAMEPITRELNDADRTAGLTTTEFTLNGQGKFRVVPGTAEPEIGAGDVRWVSVAIEDGVTADGKLFKDFVLGALNDPRGWGTSGTFQYVPTDGVADYRVLLASPATASILCPEPHEPAPSLSMDVSPSPTSEASAAPGSEAELDPVLCDEDGVIVISIYDWIAGYDTFKRDYTAARIYTLQHRLGHLTGHLDVECVAGVADIMVNQEEELPEGCEVNPWPYPDAVDTADATASPSPTEDSP